MQSESHRAKPLRFNLEANFVSISFEELLANAAILRLHTAMEWASVSEQN
jgi:hypothetical protein